MGPIIVVLMCLTASALALVRPHIGLLGYIGFVICCPQWYWRFTLPDYPYQRLLAIATLIGFFLTGLRGNRLRGWPAVSLACLCIYYVLSMMSATMTIEEYFTKMYMENIWKIVVMTILAFIVLDTPERLMHGVWVIVLAQGYNAFRVNEIYFQASFIQTLYFRWNFLDNNTYTISTIPTMGFASALLIYAPRWWQKMIAAGILLLQVHQIMLLESRGCMIASVFFVGVIVALMPKNWWTMTALIIATAIVIRLAGPRVVDEFMSSFRTGEDLDASAESRFKLWTAGAKIMMDYPWLGVGPYAGQIMVPRYYDGQLDAIFRHRKGLHNLFFEIGTGSGVPAVIAYLSFFWIIFGIHLSLVRREFSRLPIWGKIISTGVLSGIPAYWLASMFSAGGLLESSYVMAALGGAMILVYDDYRKRVQAYAYRMWQLKQDYLYRQSLPREVYAAGRQWQG